MLFQNFNFLEYEGPHQLLRGLNRLHEICNILPITISCPGHNIIIRICYLLLICIVTWKLYRWWGNIADIHIARRKTTELKVPLRCTIVCPWLLWIHLHQNRILVHSNSCLA